MRITSRRPSNEQDLAPVSTRDAQAIAQHPFVAEMRRLHGLIGNAAVVNALPPEARRVMSSGGHPLDPLTRHAFEAQLGHDLGAVRVHTDTESALSAQALSARAYTVGPSIVFGRGRYAPGTAEGRRLLAHELAHVIQQSRSGAPPKLDRNALHERAADKAAAELLRGTGRVTVEGATAVGLAREEDPEVKKALEPLKEQPAAPKPAAIQKALTAEELIEQHVFGPRVEEEIGDLRTRVAKLEADVAKQPGDSALRGRLESLQKELSVLEGKPFDPEAGGTKVPGHGRINTRAAIQIVDADGNLIALERGRWKPNMHAEEDAIAKLRKRFGSGKLPPGSRIVVGGNQVVCSDVCRPALRKFAQDLGAESVVAHVRRRAKLQGEGLASGKTTEATGLKKGMPPPQLKSEELYTAAKTTQPGGKAGQGAKLPPPKPTTGVAPVQSAVAPGETSVAPKAQTVQPPAPVQVRLPKVPRLQVRLRALGRGVGGGLAGALFAVGGGWLQNKLFQGYIEDDMRTKVEPAVMSRLESQADEITPRHVMFPGSLYANITIRTTFHTYIEAEVTGPTYSTVYIGTSLVDVSVSNADFTSTSESPPERSLGLIEEETLTTFSTPLEMPDIDALIAYAKASSLPLDALKQYVRTRMREESASALQSGYRGYWIQRLEELEGRSVEATD